MGFEEIMTKRVSCACGKGYVSQTIYGDDWNRIRTEKPFIECEDCSKKFYVESVFCRGSDPLNTWETHFLTPIGYPCYSGISEFQEFGKRRTYWEDEFYGYLIDNYSYSDLLAIKDEYDNKKFSSKVQGLARKICDLYKKKYKTSKTELIVFEIEKAIENYLSCSSNFEKREVIAIQERKEREMYNTEKRTVQFLLQL